MIHTFHPMMIWEEILRWARSTDRFWRRRKGETEIPIADIAKEDQRRRGIPIERDIDPGTKS